MFAHFIKTPARNIVPGNILLNDCGDGSFKAYKVESVERRPRNIGDQTVDRIRIGLVGDFYEYANPADEKLVAAVSS